MMLSNLRWRARGSGAHIWDSLWWCWEATASWGNTHSSWVCSVSNSADTRNHSHGGKHSVFPKYQVSWFLRTWHSAGASSWEPSKVLLTSWSCLAEGLSSSAAVEARGKEGEKNAIRYTTDWAAESWSTLLVRGWIRPTIINQWCQNLTVYPSWQLAQWGYGLVSTANLSTSNHLET